MIDPRRFDEPSPSVSQASLPPATRRGPRRCDPEHPSNHRGRISPDGSGGKRGVSMCRARCSPATREKLETLERRGPAESRSTSKSRTPIPSKGGQARRRASGASRCGSELGDGHAFGTPLQAHRVRTDRHNRPRPNPARPVRRLVGLDGTPEARRTLYAGRAPPPTTRGLHAPVTMHLRSRMLHARLLAWNVRCRSRPS